MLYLFVKMLGSGFPNPNIYYRTEIAGICFFTQLVNRFPKPVL